MFSLLVLFVFCRCSRSWLSRKALELDSSGTSTETTQHFLYNLRRHSQLAADMKQVLVCVCLCLCLGLGLGLCLCLGVFCFIFFLLTETALTGSDQ